MRILCTTCLLLIFVTSGPPAWAEPSSLSFDLYGRIGDFSWEESFNGVPLLEESGILYAAGGRLEITMSEAIWLEGIGELFGGSVDYDGALQDPRDGSLTPFTSETDYVGIHLAFNVGVRHTVAERFVLAPYAGLGTRFWRRSLGDGSPYGYDEDWTTSHVALGCMAATDLSHDVSLYVRGELRLALANNVRVVVARAEGITNVDLEPDEETTLYVEGGAEFHAITVAAYYENYRFGQSAEDTLVNIFQPRSAGNQVGIKAGVRF